MKPKIKQGRLAKSTIQDIVRWSDVLTVEEIAQKVGKTPAAIEHILFLHKPADTSTKLGTHTAIKQELRHSLAWKNLKKEFTADELRFFEEEYLKLMGQFKDDVLPSEEGQVFDYVKVTIMIHRCMQRQQGNREEIERLKVFAQKIYNKYKDPADLTADERNTLSRLEQRITVLESSEQSHINEYTKLMKEKNTLLEGLKAARDQRVSEVEDGHKFIDMIKYFQRKENQMKESKHMELIKRSTEKERLRLSRPHEYADGVMDLPILTAETLEEYDQNNQEE